MIRKVPKKPKFFQTPTGNVVKTALIDIALIGIGLLIFAYFHHVRPTTMENEAFDIPAQVSAVTEAPVIAEADGTADEAEVLPDETEIPEAEPEPEAVAEPTPEPEPTAEPTPEVTPEPLPEVTGFDLPDVFTSGEEEWTNTSYRSDKIYISLSKGFESDSTYYVADIYLKDISCLRTAFAQDKTGTGVYEEVYDMAKHNHALLAVNGDYYGSRKEGLVIRNGKGYRKSLTDDCAVLYNDGTFEIYNNDKNFDLSKVIEKSPYQAWSFGPSLLKNGEWINGFTHPVAPKNPRTIFGYYSPGHYCLVCVDGRGKNSKGMTLHEASALMKELGVTKAYNLDGGQSSVMVFHGKTVNKPADGGRPSSDIIYIGK